MKKGFTLVELSIVLVIIGLLIGGILVAQSMTSTARIVAEASQISQFDAGVTSYFAKTKYIPGDSKLNPLGNGDGLIDSGTGWGDGTQVNIYWGEKTTFWWDMNQEQYSEPNGYPHWNNPAITDGPNKTAPAAKLGSKGSFIAVSAMGDGDEPDYTINANYYFILDGSQCKDHGGLYRYTRTIDVSDVDSAVTPAEALALDQKMDDGLANSGNVISVGINTDWSDGTLVYGALGMTPNPNCSSGATYLVNTTTTVCTPGIKFGVQTGTIN